MRSLVLLPLALLALAPACGEEKDDTAGPADTDADTDTDTDPPIDPDILGSWSRRVEAAEDATFIWTGRADGTCKVEVEGAGPHVLDCLFSAEGGVFTFYDDECASLGTYAYVVAEPSTTFTLKEDACADRTLVIDGTWARL